MKNDYLMESCLEKKKERSKNKYKRKDRKLL